MTCQTQSKHGQGEQEEHEAEIDESKPSVLTRGVAQHLGYKDWPSHHWYWIKDENTSDIEHQVYQCYLKGSLIKIKMSILF